MTKRIFPTPSHAFARTVLLVVLGLAGAACSPDAGAEPEVHAEAGGEEHLDEHADGGVPGRVVLTEAGANTAGIEVEEVRPAGGGAAVAGTEVPGQVEFDPARIAFVSPRASGRIERLTAVEGDRVRAGQPLAFVLSPAFLTAQNDFIQAARRADLLAGTGDEQGARALASAARRRLQLVGANAAVLERLESGGEPLDLLPVPAPFSGSIVEMLALPGAGVEPGTPIYRIADLSHVDVVADVPEAALSRLRQGQTATVRPSAYPGRAFTGRVDRIRDVLDPETRTAKAVVRVANADGTLRPGMFAAVTLEGIAPAGATTGGSATTIPRSALVTEGPDQFVFLEVEPRTYERRAVEIAPATGDRVRVLAGLTPGERVVTRGAFTLKSELGKAAFGEHGH